MFQLIAYSPAGFADPSIAIAANRAGALGVLNLEHTRDPAQAQTALAKMARYAKHPFGIKLGSTAAELLSGILATLDADTSPLNKDEQAAASLPLAHAGTIILSPWAGDELLHRLRPLQQAGMTLLLEVTDVDQAHAGVRLGVDGLIAKGNEADGWVGEETTFILLQRLLAQVDLPVWAYGGIGIHSAAACRTAGAAGVVLDSQLALARESTLPAPVKSAIELMDGSETVCVGAELGRQFRAYLRPDAAALNRLREMAQAGSDGDPASTLDATTWQQTVESAVGWGSLPESVWPMGQAAAFAASLARRYVTVAGILDAIRQESLRHVTTARAANPLAPDAPLARDHKTTYPIVQGPMTRVSDNTRFAFDVAEAGALPFVALALMRAKEAHALLEETTKTLGDRPWGVGILGFVPQALRQEQMEVIRKFSPPYCLIAGGRPDQALALEQQGIPTYLHVPSPGLLRLFLQDGARRLIFEGRECGGHVGPRSSFVLWNTMVDVLLEELSPEELAKCNILFAGGIHDSLSAAMVATLAAPLVEKGVRIGVLMGTAYLFTQEAVQSGAILPGFQEKAVTCDRTILLESGPGHATRCVPTPFVSTFQQEKARLHREARSGEEVRQALEELNVGRLRIASKGITRNPAYADDTGEDETGDETASANPEKYLTVTSAEQFTQGMYMIGQVAALRNATCTMTELHDAVSRGSSTYLQGVTVAQPEPSVAASPSQIAIIGMSTVMPGAPDLDTFWQNILAKSNAIQPVPPDRWDADLYFDANPQAADKVYARVGGFIDDIPFDPLEFGIPPSSLKSIEPIHLLALLASKNALGDAGYQTRPFDRSRTSVILGTSGGIGELGARYLLRAGLPMLFGGKGFDLAEDAGDFLPEWTEDSFAGVLLNVTAGRIANRMDFGGHNYTVDAACASSLAALYAAVKELESHDADLVLTGGVDATQNPFGYLCFSKTRALSPTGQARVFDDEADGIVISEGITVLVLKRLADAERDGDRIYAVIQAVGGSSDGRGMGMTAPRPEGQELALQRAYEKAGFSPRTVELFEAHGTGTVVGDRTEAQSLGTFLTRHGAHPRSHALGSIKSMIGHTKAAAGAASLAKVSLALYHKVMPPTASVTRPNTKAGFGEGPLYVNAEVRPWLHGVQSYPRRAGINAFGFGGTNFHAVVEEYTGDYLADQHDAVVQEWPTELFVWAAPSRDALRADVETVRSALQQGAAPELHDLAYSLWAAVGNWQHTQPLRLAIVADSLPDLQAKLDAVMAALQADAPLEMNNPDGIYLTESPLGQTGKIAFLFPGQGSQYPNMLRQLAVYFREVAETLEAVDGTLGEQLAAPLSSLIYPPPAFTPDEVSAQRAALTQTDIAQPALGAVGAAATRLLAQFGIQPELVAGHSYGEYVALYAAGVFDLQTLARLSLARGRAIIAAGDEDLGTMAAVKADAATVEAALASLVAAKGHAGEHAGAPTSGSAPASEPDIWIANLNSHRQTIISGRRRSIMAAVEQFNVEGLSARMIPVACGFHSPLVAAAKERLADELAQTDFAPPTPAVYANSTAAPYPQEVDAIRALLADHLVNPVKFSDEIEAMYAAGARLFVEVGPGSVLSNLVDANLESRPHHAIPLDTPGAAGLTTFQHALGRLIAHGADVRLDRLFTGRAVRNLSLPALVAETKPRAVAPNMWRVNGSRAQPWHSTTPDTSAAPLASITERVSPAASASTDRPMHTNGQAPAPASSSPAAPQASGGNAAPHQTATPASHIGTRPAQHSAPSEADAVMLRYQQTMQHFLASQKEVMLTYLGQAPSVPSNAAPSESSQVHNAAPVSQPSVETAAQAHAPTPVPEAPQPSAETTPDAAQDAVQNTAPSEAVTAHEQAPARPTFETVLQQLLTIVSERTGYPEEMLQLDVDIEAKLGIDSIKRVEILGKLQRTSLPTHQQLPPAIVEQLTSLKTLRAIAEAFERAFDTESPPSPAPGEPAPKRSTGPGSQPTQQPSHTPQPSAAQSAPAASTTSRPSALARLLPVVESAPSIPSSALPPAQDGLILITDDGRGIARAAGAALQQQGMRTVILGMPTATNATAGADDPDIQRLDLGDAEAVSRFVATLRETSAPIGGILHLLPLRERTGIQAMDMHTWRDDARLDVKSLFYLAQAAAPDLTQPSSQRRTWLAAATANAVAQPTQAGIGGFVKSLAAEWPDVQCKTVDFDVDLDGTRIEADEIAERLLSELAADDGLVEVAYTGGKRQRVTFAPAALDTSAPPAMPIERDWVLLITGGARGITAEIALELAQRYQPTLILVGSSPAPEHDATNPLPAYDSPQAAKAAIIEQMRAAGETIALPQVEAAYNRLQKQREIRRNLDTMIQAGAKVVYRQADVRDETAMSRLIDGIYREYGRLDGVIHGAGIIEDKRIEDKTAASFDRVFDTKADSAFLLSHLVRPESLKFFVMFTSVAGVFGNRGQADYAATNEVIRHFAASLNQRWPGRVAALSWGPWRKAGMVSDELERQFAARGIQLIPVEEGCQAFAAELSHGPKTAADIVLMSGAWDNPQPQREQTQIAQPHSTNGTHAISPTVGQASNGHNGFAHNGHTQHGPVEVQLDLDVAHDLYLNDHRLDGKPVLPVAMAMEIMADFAHQQVPDKVVASIDNLRVMRGIVMEADTKSILLRGQESHDPITGDFFLDVEIADASRSGPPYYRASLVLTAQLPPVTQANVPEFADLQPYADTVDEAYARWLFHGPIFQGITRIEGISPQGMIGQCRPATPDDCFAAPTKTDWAIDPVVLDSGLQLIILWARTYHDITPLPAGCKRYRRLAPLQGAPVTCYLKAQLAQDGHTVLGDLLFVDENQRLLGILEGLECTGSKALNRLAGYSARQQ